MTETGLVIDVPTPLGIRVVCSAKYWERICTIKHPPMQGRLEDVKKTLTGPDEVRRSARDPRVVLFHRRDALRWVCAVVRTGEEVGYLITAYPADKVKSGDVLWTR